MNDDGRFLIEVDGKRSRPVRYQGIAILRVGKRIFAGVSMYYDGELPHETVFEVKVCPGTEKVHENFKEPKVRLKSV
jgi:hypothetical protein